MTVLKLAIPSKGRLKDDSQSVFAAAGFEIAQRGGERSYTADFGGADGVEVVFVSAREIALGLIDGTFHLGITGQDLLQDLSANPARDSHDLLPLGFGRADVVVAVPDAWLDVSTMADLEAAGALFRAKHGRRLRVATKYMTLTRRFFARASVGEYRLIESLGATEAAPAAGTADVIVDITSTGATIRANGLKVLDDGVILESEAVLAGSLRAVWDARQRETLMRLLTGLGIPQTGLPAIFVTEM